MGDARQSPHHCLRLLVLVTISTVGGDLHTQWVVCRMDGMYVFGNEWGLERKQLTRGSATQSWPPGRPGIRRRT